MRHNLASFIKEFPNSYVVREWMIFPNQESLDRPNLDPLFPRTWLLGNRKAM